MAFLGEENNEINKRAKIEDDHVNRRGGKFI